MINLFTYGSLMSSDIMFKVAQYRTNFTEAVLKEFFRSKIHGEEYPGIIAHSGQQVSGIVYFNLPAKAVKRLDAFEGEMYVRQDVEVISEKNGLIGAMTYVVKPEYLHRLSNQAWSYSLFLLVGKAKFEDDYFGFNRI